MTEKTIKTLIFDTDTTGHHIEYLHHLYLGAAQHPENTYVFAVGDDIFDKSKEFSWKPAANIEFIHLKEIVGEGAAIVNAYRRFKQLKSVVKQVRPDKVFLVSLMNFMPFLRFLSRKTKVSGIIYSIYLYDWKSFSATAKIINCLKYRLLKSRRFERLFVLNDSAATNVMNRVWKTDKYRFLTDPYIPCKVDRDYDLRKELGIANDKTMVLHLGALTERKGSLDVVKMIENTPVCDRDRYCVVFAGRLNDDIKEEFMRRLENIGDSMQVITRFGFLSYDFMGKLVSVADKVVLPYHIVNASSGIIGYCAQFEIPVFVPAKGLIFKLVRRHRIGYGLEDFNTLNDLQGDFDKRCNYCEKHTVGFFINDIFGGQES